MLGELNSSSHLWHLFIWGRSSTLILPLHLPHPHRRSMNWQKHIDMFRLATCWWTLWVNSFAHKIQATFTYIKFISNEAFFFISYLPPFVLFFNCFRIWVEVWFLLPPLLASTMSTKWSTEIQDCRTKTNYCKSDKDLESRKDVISDLKVNEI